MGTVKCEWIENWFTYITLHVLHVESVFALLALLVLLLLTATFLNDAETAGEDEEGGHHGDGDERPGRHCKASWEREADVFLTNESNRSISRSTLNCFVHMWMCIYVNVNVGS